MIGRFALLSGLGAALAGCVSAGPYPSLALREGETLAIEEPVREPVRAPADPALQRRVLELRQQAARGQQAFDAVYGPADRAVRQSGAPGSDSWIEAEQAISRLEAARGETSEALDRLDRLAAERANLPTSGGDYAALEAALAAVQEMAAAQQARIARLSRR